MGAGGLDTPGGPYVNNCMNCRLNLNFVRRDRSLKPGHPWRPTRHSCMHMEAGHTWRPAGDIIGRSKQTGGSHN